MLEVRVKVKSGLIGCSGVSEMIVRKFNVARNGTYTGEEGAMSSQNRDEQVRKGSLGRRWDLHSGRLLVQRWRSDWGGERVPVNWIWWT